MGQDGGTVGSGGAGGGGAGGKDPSNGVAGAANTGGGGGGCGNGTYNGAAGGSGIVVIRAPRSAIGTTGSPTSSTVDTDSVYTFTSSGTITF
jgi:hypothetical protein